MKPLRYILFALSITCLSTIDAQDHARLSERDIMGTSRYVGMSGAMTAIGGDPSAVVDNPAGLGVYRRSEAMFTMDYMRDHAWDGVSRTTRGLYMVPQASFIFSYGDPDEDEGVVANNFMISYQRLKTFNRTIESGSPDGDASLGSLIATSGVEMGMDYPQARNSVSNVMTLQETGYLNQYALDWGINISHRLYIGAGMRLYSYRLSADADYYEKFNIFNESGKPYDIENENRLIMSGVGFGGAFGLIYRPCGWVRLGASVQTPTVNTLRTYTSGTFSAQTDSLRYSNAPDLSWRTTEKDEGAYFAPWRASFGAALQVGDYGLVSLQYDMAHAKYMNTLHTLKAGLEVVPVLGLYINAGYAHEFTCKSTNTPYAMDPTFERQDTHSLFPLHTRYVSAGIGYRGQIIVAQVAYQYRWQKMQLYAHEAAQPYDINADTHRVVFTLGWHN